MIEQYPDQDEIGLLKKLREQVYFNSHFNFLKEHNGIRPARLHVFLGTAGAGKSTLARTMLMDLSENLNDKRMLIWLSEETTSEYFAELNEQFNPSKRNDILFFSEQETELEPEQLIVEIEKIIIQSKVSILFLDNFTTSKCWGFNVSTQSKFANDLKRICKKHGVATIIFTHTKKGIGANYEKLIDKDDVKGSSHIVNIAEFFYIIQQFQHNQDKYSTLRIDKSRGQSIKQSMYLLQYNLKSNVYVCDKALNFEKFKELFKGRNKL